MQKKWYGHGQQTATTNEKQQLAGVHLQGYVSSETYFISQTQLSKSCYGTVVPRFQVTSPYLKQILPGGFVW